MDNIVLKFGGSSVSNNENLKKVAQKIINLYNKGYKIVVVVSAQGKTTDVLLKEAYELSENPNERSLDVLLSCGEQITISKLSILLNEWGYPAISLTGWQAGIKTSSNNQNAIIEKIDNSRILNELELNKIVIVAGFQGINEKDDITTLGRGGSDTTAVAIAASLKCPICYIYSDVDGIYSSDPKKIKKCKKIQNLSYDEMLELSNEGAKVLHNRCIEIAKKYNIQIEAKSTFNEEQGTQIKDKIESQNIKSIVKNDNLIKLSFNNKENEDLYEKLISFNIFPVDYICIDNKKIIIINYKDFLNISKNISNFNIKNKKVSSISIIGLGLLNNMKIINEIIKSFFYYKNDILKISINNIKIKIIFNKYIEDDLLNKLNDLIVKD